MKTSLILLLALLCGTAHAQRWSDEQRTLASMYLAALAIDYGQTRRIVQEPQQWHEVNPLLGKHPSMGMVNAACILTPVAAFLVLDNMSSEHRTLGLRLLAGFELAVAARNQYIGLRVKF